DGNKYIDDAVSKGAVLVISETSPGSSHPGVTWVRLKNIRKAFAAISLNFYGDPLKDKYVVGVTGTNGKTTVVALIDAIFKRRMRTVKFGTLGAWCGSNGKKASLTTPEANDIYKFLAEECRGDFENVIMEVSSVALELDRVNGINFSQAIFTNLSGDHLDFHYTMENYFDSKLSLFRSLTPDKWAIINIDDEKGKSIIEIIDSKYITFGFSSEADVKPVSYKLSAKGIKALISTPAGDIQIESCLIGRINLLNIIAAIASAIVRDISFKDIAAAMKEFKNVKGRLDKVFENDFAVIIDYAHTDNALENLLLSVKELNFRKIILVFGAGGSRDTTKRPRMGAVAAEFADEVIVTSDNPRDEDPGDIIKQIIAGFPDGFKSYQIEKDREKGIAVGINIAAKGDVVIIAGKGHEDYQILGKEVIHFDDYEVVAKLTEANGV
ncbi:MAG: UDP-N-acetylmuramoyl-L-alanyl-D-glutamate--2,6-diaminopimelate ligase, partial [Candidatus Aminicenantes bacterium]|nr:UDP-N-acetylmuramoyl-L-alanyl-D-glutamate--2,6-diaminopimelate ligase [Candidatus Aminicenantes bacterium]